jgi:Domain of unknown function (DUF222)/HNH endonuclease
VFAPVIDTPPTSLDRFTCDPTGLATDALEQGFAELQRLADAVEARRLVWLAELERRAPWRRDGLLSGAVWLAQRFGLPAAEARTQVRVAVALDEMPAVRRALDEGEVTPAAVQALAAAREEHPDEFARQEDALLDQAQTRGADELRRVLGDWSQSVDAEDGQVRAERLRERRSLSLCAAPAGMVKVKGEVDPESGEVVTTALQAMVDADLRSSGPVDLRTPAQRWADALTEMARRHLDSPDRPSVAGERPHLTVTVDVQDLESGSGTAELDHAGRLDLGAARRLACDASVMRVVMAGPSQLVDVGRRTPVVSAALRRAVVVRDRGCRFPSCDRPHAWCDAHHVTHWADGGRTSLDNLVLLCRPHHRFVHEGQFRLTLGADGPEFSRPDGSRLEEGRGPPTDHR